MALLAELTATPVGRITAGRSIVAALRLAINRELPPDIAELDMLAERINLCNSEENTWLGEDLHREDTGELYNGHGRFWQCGSKLCPDCLAKQARRNRSKLKRAIAQQKLFVGEDLYFITLTTPRPNLPVLQTREILNYAWSLFRKRKYIRDRWAGAAKSEEFTQKADGIHYHYHIISRSRFIRYKAIRRIWTECLAVAFAASGLSFAPATVDGYAICKIEKCYNVNKACEELCKYITKSDSWQKMKAADLLDIARTRRFPRMFELTGTFAVRNTAQEDAELRDEASDSAIRERHILTEPSLDTQCISDGLPGGSVLSLDPEREITATYWRDFVQIHGIYKYQVNLHYQFKECLDVRRRLLAKKYPWATIRPLSDFDLILSGQQAARPYRTSSDGSIFEARNLNVS